MLTPLNKVTLAQAKAFCDDHGLDYSDVKPGLPGLATLRSRINASGLAKDGGIDVAEAVEQAPAPSAAPPRIVTSEGEETLPAAVFDKLASAIFMTSARKEGDVYIPAKLVIPADRKEAMRQAIAHRDATRADPRNPFPGKAHGDKVTLMIPIQDPKHHSGGDLPVFTNYNETAVQVGRGSVVTVDWETACVIHNAQADAVRMTENGTVEVTGKIQQFPYTRIA
jgi:hypothetical protein